MVSLYRLIKSWLTTFSKKELEQPKEPDRASVIFNLDQKGNIDIQFLWPNIELITNFERKELSKNYSALISIINLGGFKSDIIKILMRSQQETNHESDKAFLSDVLKYLIDSDNIQSDSLPLISPTKVFKTYEQ